MRLLNGRTLEMTEFGDADRPRYAILSHRWANEELSLQEFLALDPASRATLVDRTSNKYARFRFHQNCTMGSRR